MDCDVWFVNEVVSDDVYAFVIRMGVGLGIAYVPDRLSDRGRGGVFANQTQGTIECTGRATDCCGPFSMDAAESGRIGGDGLRVRWLVNDDGGWFGMCVLELRAKDTVWSHLDVCKQNG